MARNRLVDIEWGETSGVDASANNIEGWAVLKGKTVHHGKILQQIKELADKILARMDEDDDDEAGKQATQKALLKAVEEAWPAYATEVAKVVKEHGRTDASTGPLNKAFSVFREDVESRLAKLKGTSDSVRTALQAALKDKYPQDADKGRWVWVRDFDDTSVVFENDDELFAAAYTIDDEGAASLGEPERVRITYTPI
ncbi:hypothetical protein LCGC14_0662850 [marine sediment metagenome]|uniref:Uncharacterized protein n=1 Tax=marine sediment metagenome TaxID=412755 RepID=A0A0F9QT36_9ZZZZ